MLKFDVSSDIATFYWLHHWSRQSESFSAWRSLPLSNRVAKQSDGSRLIAAVKVIHNLARAGPEKSHPTEMFRVVRTYPNTVVLSGFKRDDQSNWPVSCFPVERYSISRVPSTR